MWGGRRVFGWDIRMGVDKGEEEVKLGLGTSAKKNRN
jgi:hypothetical protein